MTVSHNDEELKRRQAERETIWQQASTWLSRTLAVTLVMVLPGILGAYFDKRFGTTLLAPMGFGLGLLLGTVGLVVLAKKLTPPARGSPLAWEEPKESNDAEPNDQASPQNHRKD
jgi:hypothetical protein